MKQYTFLQEANWAKLAHNAIGAVQNQTALRGAGAGAAIGAVTGGINNKRKGKSFIGGAIKGAGTGTVVGGLAGGIGGRIARSDMVRQGQSKLGDIAKSTHIKQAQNAAEKKFLASVNKSAAQQGKYLTNGKLNDRATAMINKVRGAAAKNHANDLSLAVNGRQAQKIMNTSTKAGADAANRFARSGSLYGFARDGIGGGVKNGLTTVGTRVTGGGTAKI